MQFTSVTRATRIRRWQKGAMPTKRAILSELTADELRANVEYYHLDVHDRRVKTELPQRPGRIAEGPARRDPAGPLAGPPEGAVPRRSASTIPAERKRISPPVSWVTQRYQKGDGRSYAPRPEPPAPIRHRPHHLKERWSVPRLQPAPPPVSDTPDLFPEVLSVAQLEQYLWSAADILRGSIDSSDYKTYIFGLLFLKRLSDRFEEEAEKLIEEGVPTDVAWTDPDEHQFFVPDRARLGRHPEGGQQHRRDAEQGVRGARGAEPGAGRRPRRDRLQRRAQARRRPQPRHRAGASRAALLAGLAPQRPHGRARPSRPRLRVT